MKTSMKMQLLNILSEILKKFVLHFFKKEVVLKTLFSVTQFHISKTSNGGESGEIC